MTTIWRRACVGCTKSKRQCTKGIPACRRCIDRGIPCVYPPTRRINNVVGTVAPAPAAIQPLSTPQPVTTGGTSSGSAEGEDIHSLSFPPLQLTEADICAELNRTPAPQSSFDHTTPDISAYAWFLTPESWVADYTLPEMETQVVEDSILQRFIDGVQRWLREWTTHGKSPLHHWHLYREKMPRHVQDAYTAIATYHDTTRTPATRNTIARIFEDRVAQLLQDQASGSASSASGSHDVFDHVARVQALLTYQAIRLFDGDVRMRAQAEALIPTLFLWSKQLLEAAKVSLAQQQQQTQFLAAFTAASSNSAAGFSRLSNSSTEGPEDAMWRAWVLVESVRRTWIVSNYLQDIYLYMKHGWSECPGRVTFTMRAGLWEATSPYTWGRACRERGTLFLGTQQTQSLVFASEPEDVDEFGRAILELSFGVERIERWLGGKVGMERSSLSQVLE